MERLEHKIRVSIRRALKTSVQNEIRKQKRKIKEGVQEKKCGKTDAAECVISALESMGREVLERVVERRLGMGYRGVGNDPFDKYLEGLERAERRVAKEVGERVLGTAGVRKCMDEGNEELVKMRKREMGEGKGKKRKKGEDRKATRGEWSKGYEGQQGVFLTLNGDTEGDDDEDMSGPYGPGGGEVDEWGEIVKVKKNRKGQRARQAKARAKECRKRGEKWDSSVNWRERKDKGEGEEGEGGGEEEEVKIVLKAAVGRGGKGWKEEKGEASHPSWKAGKTKEKKGAIVEFTGNKITFD
ncbi:hypothetical protein TrCOL_g12335 [Triparma columacea]|uniref:Bud22 domain-containing protein n=1 Tax=Triparma columacea TaxID=722753 RepID=A0A9W7LF66_9STRA|nr:hypothetical protein TrCOL_g12335 [Triparma columacea]